MKKLLIISLAMLSGSILAHDSSELPLKKKCEVKEQNLESAASSGYIRGRSLYSDLYERGYNGKFRKHRSPGRELENMILELADRALQE